MSGSNLDNFGLGTPVAEAKDIHAKWRESAESLIAACTRIADVMAIYGEQNRDSDKSKFIGELIDRGVLSKLDKQRQGKSSKLSKLIAIGRSPHLQDKRVRPLLPPSYSTLYYLCLLAVQLDKADPETGTARLVNILERHKGRLDSRTAMVELNHARKGRRRTARRRQEKAAPAIAGMLEKKEIFDLVLLTPSAREMAVFADSHPAAYLEQCLPLARLINERSGRAIVALALEAQHIQYAPVILALAGRRNFPQTPATPGGLKRSDSTLLLTGDGVSPRSKTVDWPAMKSGFQDLLEKAYPGLKRRLHVFASEQKAGWQSLVAENCWVAIPGAGS